jgi:catechol 2,3-dioxygenase-like lactoylglutathione lyase family enzyme
VFDHVTIRASDRDASERFSDVLLRVIGVEHARSSEHCAEAVRHGAERRGIDHLWIGVADVAASKRFYGTIAPFGRFRLRSERPGFAHFASDGGSFSVIEREPTEHVHIAFPAADDPAVDASTARRRKPATGTTALPESGRSTTPATTARSSSTPTETTSRS